MKKTLTVLMMVLLSAMLIISCDSSTSEPKTETPATTPSEPTPTPTPTPMKKTYTVTFDLKGGTGDIKAQTVKEGEKATKPTTDPTPANTNYYAFDCWTKEGETTAFDFANTAITSDTKLVANWKNKYKVGDAGPAGGTIIYVSTDDTLSWKFIELAPGSAGSAYIGDINDGQYTYTDIDKEVENEALLKQYFIANSTTSAVLSLVETYSTTGADGKTYSDWHLPTKDQIAKAKGYLTTACWTSSTLISYGSTGTMYRYWVYDGNGDFDRNSAGQESYDVYCIRRF